MARPLKGDTEKRSITVKVRLTVSEKKQIADASKIQGATISDLLRTRTLSTLPARRKASPERAALIRGLGELGKTGSNINQIARYLNSQQQAQHYMPMLDFVIKDALTVLNTFSNQLLNLIQNGREGE